MRLQIFTASLFFAFTFIFLPQFAMASRVEVVNNTENPIKVQIKAEGSDLAGNVIAYDQEIPGECYFSFWVIESKLKGKSLYSIKGYNSAFLPGGKCDHLSVEKNYKVIFNGNDTLGVRCVAEEIQ
jgi:hypothetical protein